MKKILPILYVFFLLTLVSQSTIAQEYYYVNAENGLNVRFEPRLTSEKIVKLRFGLVVEKISDTNIELSIEDNGTQLKGCWVKIKYDSSSYPYLLSEGDKIIASQGYVFDGYLKKMKLDNSITITKIDKSKYEEWLKVAIKHVNKPKSIHHRDSIEAILKGRVEWFTRDDEDKNIMGGTIKSIMKANGQKLVINEDYVDFYLNEESGGYYPEYDILVLEGGHTSDMSFSLRTGATTETVGNPEYIIASPQNTYRLNGIFGGQECISYFFQKKVDGKFTYLTRIDFNNELCIFKMFYWITETKFIYSLGNYWDDSINEQDEFFIGNINSNNNE